MYRWLKNPTAVMAAFVALGVGTAIGVEVINPVSDPITAASPRSANPAAQKPATNAATAQSGVPASSSATSKKASAAPTPAAAAKTAWSPRPVDYPKTVTTTNLSIPMSDGTVLKADLEQPADASGKAIGSKMPVIVTITAYNKDVQQYGGGLAGGSPEYLVQRGYDQLTVDARGTGSSGGQWCAFCTRENTDSVEIMNWAQGQSWSNGSTGMRGPSYMGINQIFAAAGHPTGLKAIFPQVPADDVYRDVVASGGQVDVGFIPLWLGLVTATGVTPPTTPTASSMSSYLTTLTQHGQGAGNFTLPLMLEALTGGQAAYDGSFYQQRSPGTVISQVNVPTFIVGGEYDLFQRGEPMLFDNLQSRGIPTKIIVGPWNHLQASGGTVVADAGLGSLSELQLRWFDHYVKGLPDSSLDSSIPPMTYYQIGTGKWLHLKSQLGGEKAVRYNLSGTSMTAGAAGGLTQGTAQTGQSAIYPIALAGLCTRSTDQWTAGISTEVPIPNPCLTNNAWNDKTGVVFSTPALTKRFQFEGPIDAHLNVSSTSGDGLLSVAIEDEAPDGTVTRISGGWQVISLRALDESKSVKLDGKIIQPFHPFTQASQQRLSAGQVAPVDVEIFPTAAAILPGHKLRIAIQSFDLPHLLSPLPNLPNTLGVISVSTSAAAPSWITLPGMN